MSEREFDTAVYVRRWNAETYRYDEVAVLRDADVREIGETSYLPGKRYQLRVPSIDNETGTETDVDGDRSFDRAELVSAEVTLGGRGSITIKGYEQEEVDDRYTGNFLLTEWHAIPYSWIVEHEREAAEDAKEAETMSDREKSIVMGLRWCERNLEEEAKARIGYTNTWTPFLKESKDAEGYLPARLPNGVETTFEEVTEMRVGDQPIVMVSGEDKANWDRGKRTYYRGVKLLTKAEHIADGLLAEQRAERLAMLPKIAAGFAED